MKARSTHARQAPHLSKLDSHIRRLAFLALIAALSAACSSSTAAPKPRATGPTPTVTVPVDLPVVVALDVPFAAPDVAVLDEMIAAFEAANPEIWVEVTEIRDNSDDPRGTIADALGRSHSAIDVYEVDNSWLARFAAEGWLRPLDDYVESYGLDLGEFLSPAIQEATIDGQLFALPWTVQEGAPTGQSLVLATSSQVPDEAFRLMAFLAGYEHQVQ